MELEPITRQEKIIAGQDLTPITRMEMFLKQFGGSGGGGGGVQVVTITSVSDGSGSTSSHTGAEINAMALKGVVVARIKVDGMETTAAYFGGCNFIGNGVIASFGACFTLGFVDTIKGRYGAMYFYVEPETKKVLIKQIYQTAN